MMVDGHPLRSDDFGERPLRPMLDALGGAHADLEPPADAHLHHGLGNRIGRRQNQRLMWSAELQALNTTSRGAANTRDTRTGAGSILPATLSILLIAFSFAVQGFEVFAEPIEPALPLRPPVGNPSLGFGEGGGIDAASAHPARLLRCDKPRHLQHREVLHHRRQRHFERPLELTDQHRPLRQPLDHRPAGRIGQGLERRSRGVT